MAKIDLSGNSGWQSKSGDKMKALQKGNYYYHSLELDPHDIQTAWIKAGNMVQVQEGSLILVLREEELVYEAGDLILFNEENCHDVEIRITEKVKLQIIEGILKSVSNYKSL